MKEQIRIDQPRENSSVSLSLSIIEDTMDMCHETVLDGSVRSRQLSDAVQDDYVRSGSKAARYKPNKKDTPSAQNPIVIKANAKQKLNIGGFSDAVFNDVASYLGDDANRFVAEVDSIEL